jgi:hypothetical protein
MARAARKVVWEQARRAAGRCFGCEQAALRGRWCAACGIRDRQQAAVRRRRLKQQRIAASLCHVCGQEVVPPGVWTCPPCRERRLWRTLERLAIGRCQRCQGAVDRPGARRCAPCRLKFRVYMRDYRRTHGADAKRVTTVSPSFWTQVTGAW